MRFAVALACSSAAAMSTWPEVTSFDSNTTGLIHISSPQSWMCMLTRSLRCSDSAGS